MANDQFNHLRVATTTLEYSACLITHYFTACEPHILPRTAWWGEDEIILFALKQFKALREAGVAIDDARLNEFLP